MMTFLTISKITKTAFKKPVKLTRMLDENPLIKDE